MSRRRGGFWCGRGEKRGITFRDIVADLETFTYQVTATFDTSCVTKIRTAPAINYIACWQLAVSIIRYLVFLFV